MVDNVFRTADELKTALGERVRRLRLSRNIDQRTVAERAGLSETALRNLETGRGSTVETLLRTLKALDYIQGIDMLAPDATIDPLALLRRPKPQQRVRRPHRSRAEDPKSPGA